MADVFPARNLPGEAENWGRAVENRVVAGEDKDGQIEQKVDNGLRATSGQLAVLSRQLDAIVAQQLDLMGRVSYSSSTSQFQSVSTTGSTVLAGSALPVTLDMPRVVQVMCLGQVVISNIVGPSAPSVRIAVSVNSSLVGDPLSRGTMYAPFRGAGSSGEEGAIITTALVSLPVGSHLIEPVFQFTRQQSGDGAIFNSVSTTVNVLQRS